MNEGSKERENNDGNKNEAMKKKDNIQSNSKCIIKLAVPLKSDENSIRVCGVVPQFDNLNNKVNEVNNRLALMCGQRDVPFISNSETIDSSEHLNESKLHLNGNGLKVFAESFSVFLKKFN